MDLSSVFEGAIVRGRDGEQLGRVVRVDDDCILIEHRAVLTKTYVIPVEHASRVDDGELFLSTSAIERMQLGSIEVSADEPAPGLEEPDEEPAGPELHFDTVDDQVVEEERVTLARGLHVEHRSPAPDTRGKPRSHA